MFLGVGTIGSGLLEFPGQLSGNSNGGMKGSILFQGTRGKFHPPPGVPSAMALPILAEFRAACVPLAWKVIQETG